MRIPIKNKKGILLALISVATLVVMCLSTWWRHVEVSDQASNSYCVPPTAAEAEERGLAIPSGLEPRKAISPGRDAAGRAKSVERGESGARLITRIVSAESNSPLAGIQVWLLSGVESSESPSQAISASSGEFGITQTTDTDGLAEFSCPPGTALTVEVPASPSHSAARGRIAVLHAGECGAATLQVWTTDDTNFWGKVITSATQTAIIDARLSIGERFSGVWQGWPVAAVSQSDGYFQVRAASWKTRMAVAASAGYGPKFFMVGSGHETRETALEIMLDCGATLQLIVTRSTDRSCVGAAVTISAAVNELCIREDPNQEILLSRLERRGVTDSAGICQLADLPPLVALRVEVSPTDGPVWRDQERPVLKPCSVSNRNLQIGDQRMMHGLVLDEMGSPVNRLVIWRRRATSNKAHLFGNFESEEVSNGEGDSAVTDDVGRFEFRDVASGGWWIGPAPYPFQKEPVKGPERIAPIGDFVNSDQGSTEHLIVLQVSKGLYLDGRVIDSESKPVAGAQVMAKPGDSTDGDISVLTDELGIFSIGPVSRGIWTLKALPLEGNYLASEAYRGAAGTQGIALTMRRGATIRGRVFGLLNVEPSSRGTVMLISKSKKPEAWSEAEVDEGNFVFTGVPSDEYYLCVRLRNGFSGIRTGVIVESGALIENQDVNVEPAGKLIVKSELTEAAKIILVRRGSLLLAVIHSVPGSEITVVVPAGELEIEIRDDSPGDFGKRRQSSVRLMDVAAGELQRLVLAD